MTGLEEEPAVDKDVALKLDDRHSSRAHQQYESSKIFTSENPLPSSEMTNSIDTQLMSDSRSGQSGGQSIEHAQEIESLSANPSERSDLEVISSSFDQIKTNSSGISSAQADLSEDQSNDQSDLQLLDHALARKFSSDRPNSTMEILTDSIASALEKSAAMELSREAHEDCKVAPGKDVQSASSSSSHAVKTEEFEVSPNSSKTENSYVANLSRDETEVSEQYSGVKPVIRSEGDAKNDAYEENASIQVVKLDGSDASHNILLESPAEKSETVMNSIGESSLEFDSLEHESSSSKEEVKVDKKSVEIEPILDQFKPIQEIEGSEIEQSACESGTSGAVDGSNLIFQSKQDGLFVQKLYETRIENQNPSMSSADKQSKRGSPEVNISLEFTLKSGQTEDESFAVDVAAERTSPHSQKLSTVKHEESGLSFSGNETLEADLENLKKKLIRKESSSSISDDDDELLDDPSSSTNSVINTAALSLKSDFLARQLKQRSEDEDYYRKKLVEKESELESAEGKIKALQVRLIRYAKDDRAKDLRLAHLEQELNEVTEKMHMMVDMVSSSTGTPALSNGHGRAPMPAKASSKHTSTKICAIL